MLTSKTFRTGIAMIAIVAAGAARAGAIEDTIVLDRAYIPALVLTNQPQKSAAATRAKPIVLTGLAAMLGAFFILDDPIFNGLAVALIFGILVSTVLTLVVIPVLYYAYRYRAVETPAGAAPLAQPAV